MNPLKKIQSFLTAPLLACALLITPVLSVSTALAGDPVVSGANASAATNRSVAIITAQGVTGAAYQKMGVETPEIKYLSVTSDLSSASVKFYRSSAAVDVTQASSGATNRVFVGSSGATFATSNQVIIVQHVAADTYERLVSLTNTSSTVTFTTATASAIGVGDKIYIATVDAIEWIGVTGATPKVFNPSGGIYSGVPGRPLLFEVDGTSSAKIQNYTVHFRKPENL